MGTNYYTLSRKHICKIHSAGNGKLGITWQLGDLGLGNTIEEIKERLQRLKYVKHEYKEKMPIKEFQEIVKKVIKEGVLWDYFC